jgi:hypothetical protein
MDGPGPAGPPEILHLDVSGGYANLKRSVTIGESGSVERELGGTRSRRALEPTDLGALLAELDASGLFDQDREYPPPPGAADLQRYEIRYRGVTVVAYDTTVPPELGSVLSRLEELASGR